MLLQNKERGMGQRHESRGNDRVSGSEGADMCLLGDPGNGSNTASTATLQTIDQAALPNIRKAYKRVAGGSAQEGPSGTPGLVCVWAQAGAVTRTQGS